MKLLLTQRENDVIEEDYIKYFSKYHQIEVISNNLISNICLYDYDGFVLTGGGDFIEQPKRNLLEKELVKYSIENRILLLGICRGMQHINFIFGGKLRVINNHVRVNHKIKIFNGKEGIVNSYHNYGMYKEDIPNCFNVIATCGKVVESMKHKDYNIYGVMWHPERDNYLTKWIDGDCII